MLKRLFERRLKRSHMKKMTVILCLLPVVALASGAPAPDVVRDNAGLFQWVLGLALVGNGIFILRTLKSIDRLWERTDKLESALSVLSGEHKARYSRSEWKNREHQ